MITERVASLSLRLAGWRFEGTLPTLDEIDAFEPWNKKR